jgi:hypothetical protein
MFLRILLYGFLIYILYKLIFDFAIPVYKATRQIRKGFKDMHNRMQDQMNQQSSQPSPPPPVANPSSNSKDYIEFEEIK